MSKPLLLNVEIADIAVRDRLRPAEEAAVAALAADIAERGLRSPVEVAETPDGGWVLVSGLHRLTACRELGWTRSRPSWSKGPRWNCGATSYWRT